MEREISMSREKLRIAIDGPSGAGKSTIAKKVAEDLSIDYIDTGAMYRAIAYKILENHIGLEQKEELEALLSHTEVDLQRTKVLLDGKDISDQIRTPQISKMASDCSALPQVREKLVSLQRKMAQEKSVIMDGRDIGTNVLVDAEFKFFLTATVEERARRRYKELMEKGQEVSLEQVEEDIRKRDHNDSTRKLNPLRKAEDAIEIDSTLMSIDEVAEKILSIVRR